jgi:tRNA(adenine34) deaminase
MLHARLSRVVFGAPDPKTGACGSIINLFEQERLNHHASLTGGVMEEECASLLKAFFAERRKEAQKRPAE